MRTPSEFICFCVRGLVSLRCLWVLKFSGSAVASTMAVPVHDTREMVCFSRTNYLGQVREIDFFGFTSVGQRPLTIGFTTRSIPDDYQIFLAFLQNFLIRSTLGTIDELRDGIPYALVLVDKNNDSNKVLLTHVNFRMFKATNQYDIWCRVVNTENMNPANWAYFMQETEEPNLDGAHHNPIYGMPFSPSFGPTHNHGTRSESVLYDCVHSLANRVGFLERSLGT